MQRLVMRLILLAAVLSIVSLLIFGRCGLQEHEHKSIVSSATAGNPTYLMMKLTTDHELPEQRDVGLRQEVQRLLKRIRNLKLQLFQLNNAAREYGISLNSESRDVVLDNLLPECESFVRYQISQSELSERISCENEYEVIPFHHFTSGRIYPTELGLGKRVAEKLIGDKRKDLLHVIKTSLDILNKNLTYNKYTLNDFQEGIYRTLPSAGTQYELYFRLRTSSSVGVKNFSYVKVVLLKPFLSVIPISSNLVIENRGGNMKELVHIVLPVENRLKTYQKFMDKFIKIGLRNDRNVVLSVVYFGEAGLKKAEAFTARIVNKFHSNSIRLIPANETYSRSRAVHIAIEQPWDAALANKFVRPDGDVLLFVCDVDIVFSARFLDRCRWNSQPNLKVYYPIVFSLYNPYVIYTLQGKSIPSETDQLYISRETGFWRDSGFGMTCQYKSDFLRMRSSSENRKEWGSEDVTLYRKYLNSKIRVVRASDPGIFHTWHPKTCNEENNLTLDQYRSCIRSRALNEASHSQLGFLVFGNESNLAKPSSQPKGSQQASSSAFTKTKLKQNNYNSTKP